MPGSEPRRVILAVCGPPGSGKTTIATRAHDRLTEPTTKPVLERPLRILHSDEYSRRPYDHMFETVTGTDAHFILDGTFYRCEHQQRFLDLSDSHFVLVRADLDTCLRRDYERDGIGEKAVRVIHSEFHHPPTDMVLDTTILPIEDAVRLLTDRARDWLGDDATDH